MIFLVVNSFGADTSFWSQKPTEWIEKKMGNSFWSQKPTLWSGQNKKDTGII